MSHNDAKVPDKHHFDVQGDIVNLTMDLVNFPSVSGSEKSLCDAIES
ncbi:MAG: succinyl-diaminopimelate desuccinylase, partial [Actinobacteria bacterium]|nr:succinyl-diaminopimelate desuccinylase [Actinomycetota bacterium]